jgi:thiol-disulfide isomerase/thioredoxin
MNPNKMKNLLSFIIMTGILVSNCSRKENSEPKIDYKGSAYVKFLASNVIDSIDIETVFWSYFPNNNREIKRNLKILKDDNYYLEINMIIPALVEFTINKDPFTTYLIPGDTLEIILKQESVNQNKSITSYFIDDEIFNYCQEKFKKFGYYMIIDNHGPLRLRWFLKMITTHKQFDTQIAEADSVQNISVNFLEDNSKYLPEWFLKMERNNIKYSIANCKMLFWGSLTNFSRKEYHIVNVPIYNPEAHLSFEYYRFINAYFSHGNPVENNITGTQRMLRILNKEYPRIDSSLRGDIKSFYITGVIEELYIGSNSDIEASDVDFFIKSHNLNFSNEEQKYIDNEKDIALNKQLDLASLKPGDSAPGFDLKDITGKNHKLSDFKGKIIYLHFWATWCGPCLGELPVLNKIVNDVNSDKVAFVNVCLDNDIDKWKQIISKQKLLGMNLVCDGNRSKSLESLYKISSIPHYTLIDKNGLIIKNNCVRPGNITTEISQLLGKE